MAWQDLFEALKYGFWQGAAGVPRHFGGLVDRLGGEGQSEPTKWLLRFAEELNRKSGEYEEPDTLAEKIASGIGQAPGMLGELLPYAAAAGAVVGTGGLGAAALAGGLGFGAHGAADVFSEGGDTDEILKEALLSGAEGAAFGGLGRFASALGKGRDFGPLLRSAVHGGGAAGVSGGMTALRGGDAEDIAAAASTMGLFGALGGMRYDPILSKGDRAFLAKEAAAREARARGEKTKVKEEPVFESETPFDFRAAEAGWEAQANKAVREYVDGLKVGKNGQISMRQQDLAARNALKDAGIDITHMSDVELVDFVSKRLSDFVPGAEEIVRVGERGSLSGRIAAAQNIKESTSALAEKFRMKLREAPSDAPLVREALEQGLAMAEMQGRQAAKFILEGSSEAGRALNTYKRIAKFETGDLMGLLGERRFRATQDHARLFKEAAERGDIEKQQQVLNSVNRPNLWDKTYELWIMGLLSNPTTHLVNTISNITVQGLEVATRFGQAAVEKVIPKKALGRERYGFSDAASDAMTRVLAIPRALKEVNSALWSREGSLSEYLDRYGGKSEQAMEAIGGTLGKIVRLPGNALAAEDAFFKTIAAHAEASKIAREFSTLPKDQADKDPLTPTWAGAKRVIDDIVNGKTDDRTMSALARVRTAAEDQTFTNPLSPVDESAIRRFGFALDKMRKVPLAGGAQPGRVIVPFLRTPTNIVLYALRHSPAGITRALRMVKEKNPAYAQEFARAGIGTMMMGWMMDLAANGQISGGGPVDPNVNRNLRETGWQPYSIKIGDTWVSYQRIEPLASIVGAAADLTEVANEPVEEKFGKLVDSIKDNLTNKTFMLGVENMMNAWADPGRYGQNWIESMAASTVPFGGLLGGIARATDPYSRRISGESADPLTSTMEAAAHGVMSRVPGLREELPINYAITGQPTRYDEGMTPGQYAANIFSPFRVSKEDPTATLNAELARLGQLGLKIPTPPNRSMTLPRELQPFIEGGRRPQKLTEEEYAINNMAHAMAAQMLTPIIQTPSYQMLTDESKAEYINRLYTSLRRRTNPLIRQRMSARILGGK